MPRYDRPEATVLEVADAILRLVKSKPVTLLNLKDHLLPQYLPNKIVTGTVFNKAVADLVRRGKIVKNPEGRYQPK